MNIYNVLDKLKAIAEKDPHYKDAVNSAKAYEYKTVSEGVHGEKCNECGMYESHCECPKEDLEEAKPDFLDLDKDGNKKEPMKKAADDAKKEVKESPELKGILRHAGIMMVTPSGTMANQADNLVESIEKTKSILNENYSGGLNLTPVAEVDYSAKKARAGQDIGKPGKQFAKIAKSAGERYGSKERGEKVAGAVLAKLRKGVKEADMEEGQFHGGTVTEKWDTETQVAPSEKGKYAGKTAEELRKSLAALKKSGPHTKGSPEYGRMKELQFAIRAKTGWGKVSEDGMVTDPKSGDEMGAYEPPLGEEITMAEAASNAARMARIAKSCARDAFSAVDRRMFLKAAELFAAGDETRGLNAINRMDTEARDDFYMGCDDAGIQLPMDEANVNVPDTGADGRNSAAITLGEKEKTHKGGTIIKTPTGIKHQAKEIDWENEENEMPDEPRGRGRPKKKESEKVSAHLPWGGKPPRASLYKLPKHQGRTWGIKGDKKFSRTVNESIEVINNMIVKSYPAWKRQVRDSYPGVIFNGDAVKCQAIVEGVEVDSFTAPITEKAVSRAQQRFMGMVHAAQKGSKPASPEVAKVAKTMSKKAAHDFAATKHKGLPGHVESEMEEGFMSGKDLPWQKPGQPAQTKTMVGDYNKDIVRPGQAVLQKAKDLARSMPVKEDDLEEISRGEYIKQQDAAAERSGAETFKAFGQEFSTKEIDETIAMLERMKALAGLPVSEETKSEEDDHAEKAGKKVAKDIEHDDKKDHDETDEEKRDDDAEEEGEEVTKDIEHDDEKDEKEKEDKVDESESSKSGYYGKGVYETYENKFEQLIAEDISVSTNQSTTGDDTVTVMATKEDAQALVDLLKGAGLGSDVYQKYQPCSTCGQAPCGCQEAVTEEENSGNSTEGVEYGDVDELVKRLSGGLNGMKLQYAKGYKGDNDITTIKGQAG